MLQPFPESLNPLVWHLRKILLPHSKQGTVISPDNDLLAAHEVVITMSGCIIDCQTFKFSWCIILLSWLERPASTADESEIDDLVVNDFLLDKDVPKTKP